VALEILGLDGLSESVYRAMLANPDADLDELAGKLDVSRADINQALKRLVELSLVAERSPGRIYAPINPDVALDALLSLEQAELSRRERQLLEARAELSRLVRSGYPRSPAIREARRIDGRELVLEVLQELSARCYKEMLSVLPGGPVPQQLLDEAAVHDIAVLNRGVSLRFIYTRQQLADDSMRDYMHMMRERGADIRVADTLPHRLVIYDRTVSFLPVDPLRPGPAALIVREPAITANLVMLFESLWVGARPCGRVASSASISLSVRPSRWPISAKESRLMSDRRKRRWLPSVRIALTSPRAS